MLLGGKLDYLESRLTTSSAEMTQKTMMWYGNHDSLNLGIV